MKKFTDHCLPPNIPASFGNYMPTCLGGRPPLNVIESLGLIGTITLYASLAATAASTYMSYSASQEAAKQSELNAQAQNNALISEKNRQTLEFEENRRRLAQDQKRFRASQLAKIADSGIVAGVGTALEIESATWREQQISLADKSYVNEIAQGQLSYQAKSALSMGASEAAGYRRQGTGQIIAGLGSMVNTAGGAYRGTTGGYKAPDYTGTSTKTVSQRPAGL